ncbi:hypothetical protein ABPG74_001688 [Tetrahymena malaccensis]
MGTICFKSEQELPQEKSRKRKYSLNSINDNINTQLVASFTELSDVSEEFDFFSFQEPILYNERCVREQLGRYISRHLAAYKKLNTKMAQFNSKNQNQLQPATNKKILKKLQTNIIREHPFFKEFKYELRISTPLRSYKDILKKVFDFNWDNLEFKYNIIKDVIFENTDPNQIMITPQFSNEDQYSKMEDNMSIFYLNEQGMLSLKRILWSIKENNQSISFNPLLKYVVQFLLCFFSESEVYFMVSAMLEDSQSILESDYIKDDIAKKLKFHFTLDQASFQNFCALFQTRIITACSRMKQLSDHFSQVLGISLQKVFGNLITKGFYPAIPLIAHFQVMLSFIKDGLRVLHNVGFSLLETHYKQLLLCQTVEQLNLTLASTPTSLITSTTKLREFFKVGFKNKLKKTAVVKLRPQKQNAQTKFQIYYRPKVREHSYVLQYNHFELIWKWLPNHLKLLNPTQIYSTQVDGYSLLQMYLKAKEFKNLSMLLIIKTSSHIFGAYCDKMLNIKEEKLYYGSNESFVFQIEPNPKPYYSSGLNNNHIFVDQSYFQIGSDSTAIYLNTELKGKTFSSETYNSLPLNEADPEDFNACSFDALEVEIYTLSYI